VVRLCIGSDRRWSSATAVGGIDEYTRKCLRVTIPVCRSGQARTHPQPTNATRRCLRSGVRGKDRSSLARTIRCKDAVRRHRQPLGEWLCRVGRRQATRRTIESRVVLELTGGLLGDRPLATGLQPLPHPQSIELSGPRCVCGSPVFFQLRLRLSLENTAELLNPGSLTQTGTKAGGGQMP
jgi:hypothetical protein